MAKLRKNINLTSLLLKVIFHSLGFGSVIILLGIAILIFMDIVTQGKFIAVEPNQTILCFEILLVAYAIFYFSYLFCYHMKKELEL